MIRTIRAMSRQLLRDLDPVRSADHAEDDLLPDLAQQLKQFQRYALHRTNARTSARQSSCLRAKTLTRT